MSHVPINNPSSSLSSGRRAGEGRWERRRGEGGREGGREELKPSSLLAAVPGALSGKRSRKDEEVKEERVEGGREGERAEKVDLEAGGESVGASMERKEKMEGGLLGRWSSSSPGALHSMESAMTHLANEEGEHFQRRMPELKEEEELERRWREREQERKGLLSFGEVVRRLGSFLQRGERSEVEKEGEGEKVKEEFPLTASVPWAQKEGEGERRKEEYGEREENEVDDSDFETDYREAEEGADFDVYSNLDVAADIEENRPRDEGGEEEAAEGWDSREVEEGKDVDDDGWK